MKSDEENVAESSGHEQGITLEIVRAQAEEAQKELSELKSKKHSLEEKIITSEFQLNNIRCENEVAKIQIGEMREILNEIDEYQAKDRSTLEELDSDSTQSTIQELLKIENNGIRNNLEKMRENARSKEDEAIQMEMLQIPNQRNRCKKDLNAVDDQILLKNGNATKLNDGIERFKQDINKMTEELEICRKKIEGTRKKNQELEVVLQNKQIHSDELKKQTRDQLIGFNQFKEQKSSYLEGINMDVQKKELTIKDFERAIKTQQHYINNQETNLDQKTMQISEELAKNEKMTMEFEELQTKLAEVENQLKSDLECQRNQAKCLEARLLEKKQISHERNLAMADAVKRNEDENFSFAIEGAEKLESDLKEKCASDELKRDESKTDILQSQLDSLNIELTKFQEQSAIYEREMSESFSNRNTILKELNMESEKQDDMLQTVRRGVVQEMHSVKVNYDEATADQTRDSKEQQKELQMQIDAIELDARNFELTKSLSQKEIEPIPRMFQKKQQKPTRSRPATFPRPQTPSNRNRNDDLTEVLSGSSVEGVVLTAADIQRMAKEKNLRRQARERRRSQTKPYTIADVHKQ